MAQKSKWPQSTVLRAAVDVTKTATSALDHSELDGLLKNFIFKKEYFLSPNSLEACKLYSHLGGDLRVRDDLKAAEDLCYVGLGHRHECRHPDHAGLLSGL
jgi:hypothetical protein